MFSRGYDRLMMAALSSQSRLLAATLIDWTGTGFYLALSAIFLTRSAGLAPSEVGLVMAIAGTVAFFGSVHVGRLGDRIGPRTVLLALYALRASAFVGLTLLHDLGATLVMLSVIALGDQAASSMYQALANVMATSAERVGLMARMRVVTNIGITLGTVPAGIALASHGNSFAALLLGNAASYLLAGIIVATLPAASSPAAPVSRRRLLVPSPATATMIGINGLMSLWVVILNIGLPLWIVDSTTAPRALAAILYGTNTVVAIFVQARVARWVSSYLRAAHAQRLAGVMLALCCGCIASSAFTGSAAATVLLAAGVLCLSGGELLTVSSAWQVSFKLAPVGRSAEFFATYGLGRAGSQVAGPILMTVAVLALGVPGWLALGGLFVIGGLITPWVAHRAYDHPLIGRKPPTGQRASGLQRLVLS
jgi:MFS family permease